MANQYILLGIDSVWKVSRTTTVNEGEDFSVPIYVMQLPRCLIHHFKSHKSKLTPEVMDQTSEVRKNNIFQDMSLIRLSFLLTIYIMISIIAA